MGTDDGIDKSAKDLGDQISSPCMGCKLLGKAVDMTDQHGIIKPVLEHKEPATTAGFFPIPRQDCMGHLVETLGMKDVKMMKQAEGGLATLHQGQESLTLELCGPRQISRLVPKATPGQMIAVGNLRIKNAEVTALDVHNRLKLKGQPPDGGPEYSLRSIRATVELLKEAQDAAIQKQGLKDKMKSWLDNTSRGHTLYSIGEKVAEVYEKYFPKL